MTATNAAGSDDESKTNYIYSYGINHPRLINVTASQGYTNNGTAPWSTAETEILAAANTASVIDYTSPTYTKSYVNGNRSAQMATAYQITGNTTYANKTVEALINMWVDWNVTYADTSQNDYITGLMDYAYAYDQIHPLVGSSSATLDYTNNSLIRTNLALATNSTYYQYSTYFPNLLNNQHPTLAVSIATSAGT